MNIARIVTAALATLVLASAAPALGQTALRANAGATVNASAGGLSAASSLDAHLALGRERADREIQRRIDMLTMLEEKVAATGHLSASEKAEVSSTVTGQISSLSGLKTKIEGDTDAATLRADTGSIAASYRIFLLIIPRARIDIAADKIEAVADLMSSFGGKLSSRISASASSTAPFSAELSDFAAKTGDAQIEGHAAAAAVASLQPDNGDKTIERANSAALKDARAKLKAALADLHGARQDAGVITRAFRKADVAASASARADAAASTSAQ